jgi:hypothetical protein
MPETEVNSTLMALLCSSSPVAVPGELFVEGPIEVAGEVTLDAARISLSVLPSARWRDARGTSLAVTLTVGHLYDVTQLIQLVQAIRPICGRSR